MPKKRSKKEAKRSRSYDIARNAKSLETLDFTGFLGSLDISQNVKKCGRWDFNFPKKPLFYAGSRVSPLKKKQKRSKLQKIRSGFP